MHLSKNELAAKKLHNNSRSYPKS